LIEDSLKKDNIIYQSTFPVETNWVTEYTGGGKNGQENKNISGR
jgi:hypothetical protein